MNAQVLHRVASSHFKQIILDENADIIEHERVSNFIFSFYRHRESSAVDESICKPDTCDDFYSTIQLPSAHFEGLWERYCLEDHLLSRI